MPDQQQAVIGGIDCHTDFHVAAALDPLGRVLGAFPATRAGYRLNTWLRRSARSPRSVSSPPGRSGHAVADRSGLRVIEVNQPHPHCARVAARTTPSTPRPLRARCSRAKRPQPPCRHHRHRRGDPPAQRDPKQRRQGPLRRVVPARRPARHRSRRVARAARHPPDPRGQGQRVRSTAARSDTAARRSRPGRQSSTAQPRASRRPARRRGRRARSPARPAGRHRSAHNPVTARVRHPPHRGPARRRGP